MDADAIESQIRRMAYNNAHGFGGTETVEINGHKVRTVTKQNTGRSGKGFTTFFYVDGKLIAKEKVVSALLA
jgi:hypothetical protein